MTQDLVGKWEYSHGENLEEFMDAWGVSDKTKASILGGPAVTVELSTDGQSWTSRVFYKGELYKETVFQSGIEYDDVNLQKQPMKVTTTIDGSTMKTVQKLSDREIVRVNEIVGDKMISTYSSKGKSCVVHMKRIQA